MDRFLRALLVLMLVLVVGCSGSSTSSAPTTAPPTVRQFSSEVSRVQAQVTGIKDCAAKSISTASCPATARRLGEIAESAAKTMSGLGTPPTEIADLTQRTIPIFQEVQGAVQAVLKDCEITTSAACKDALDRQGKSLDALTDNLAAWTPYLPRA